MPGIDPVLDPAAWHKANPNPRVLIIDGPAIKVSTRNNHLQIVSGPAGHLTITRIPRIPRTIERVMILANFGYITIEAQRWMKDAGITWAQIDRNGRILAISPPGRQDSRLIRAQAQAVNNPIGLKITRYLLGVKLGGQAQNIEKYFVNAGESVAFIQGRARALIKQETIRDCMTHEGLAAENYWQAWQGNVPVPFPTKDMPRVPRHWLNFTQRHSLAYENMKNRNATDPINAMLSYIYKVAETECIHACHAAGISPTLGICHTDKPNRDSMALDLLETLRPACDQIILEIFRSGEAFDRRWLMETKGGIVRLLPPLTHALASHAPTLALALAPHVWHITDLLAASAGTYAPVPLYKARTGPRTTRHVGYPAARLKPGTGASDLIPDALWADVCPLLPARPVMGRPNAVPDRVILAAMVARYLVKVPWSQALVLGRVHRSTVDARMRAWQREGAWEKIVPIVQAYGHLPGLIQ